MLLGGVVQQVQLRHTLPTLAHRQLGFRLAPNEWRGAEAKNSPIEDMVRRVGQKEGFERR